MDMETVLRRPPISLFLIFSYRVILTPAHLPSKRPDYLCQLLQVSQILHTSASVNSVDFK